eukprot:6232991-Amphidinium_carterae.1
MAHWSAIANGLFRNGHLLEFILLGAVCIRSIHADEVRKVKDVQRHPATVMHPVKCAHCSVSVSRSCSLGLKLSGHGSEPQGLSVASPAHIRQRRIDIGSSCHVSQYEYAIAKQSCKRQQFAQPAYNISLFVQSSKASVSHHHHGFKKSM